ncbi:Hypothetical predicted protein, partial [Marmota monax]
MAPIPSSALPDGTAGFQLSLCSGLIGGYLEAEAPDPVLQPCWKAENEYVTDILGATPCAFNEGWSFCSKRADDGGG